MRAPVWNRTSISCSSGRRHHQIGFESKIVAGDQGWSLPGHGHRRLFGCQRSSPAVAGVVAAVHCALADFVIRVDLSRSRRRPSLPCRVCASPEMKKAAEVDFTWAAFPRTYEKRL